MISGLEVLQRYLLKNVKLELKERLGREPKSIEKYYNEYRREIKKYRIIPSKKNELIEALIKQDIVLCGDYHTLKQAQNTAYKIILELIKKREVVLCLELINAHNQRYLERFIRKEISEKQFLELIDYDETWGFNWKNYLPLFKVAMEHGLEIYGINKAPDSLKARDQFASKKIVELSNKHPKALIFVLFGDLHIASAHLPKEIDKVLKKQKVKKQVFQIFQNCEEIYWKLKEKNLEDKIDVLKVNNKIFVIQNTPPWIKLQSFLIWAEHGEELGTSSVCGHEISEDDEDGFENSADVAKEQFFYLVDMLCSFFEIESSKLVDPEVLSIHEIGMLQELKGRNGISKERYNEIVDQILIRKSYFIPEKNLVFLSSYSMNHAAHAAMIYLFYQVAGFKHPKANGGDIKHDFYIRVLEDAIGFLGAKIINPKRKCFTYSDHSEYWDKFKKSKNPNVKRKVKVAKFTMQHKVWEDAHLNGLKKKTAILSIFKADKALSHGISKTIGYQLGNAIYHAMAYNILDKTFIFNLIKRPVNGSNGAWEVYLEILGKLKDYKPVYKSKTEIF